MNCRLVQNTLMIIRRQRIGAEDIGPPPGFNFVIYNGQRVTYNGQFVIYPIT